MKEAEAHAVKLEGGKEVRGSIKRILTAGIPVMGHLGLTPQSIYKFGTYTVRAKEEEEAKRLVEDAKLLEDLGCFAIVLEKIPAELGKQVAEALTNGESSMNSVTSNGLPSACNALLSSECTREFIFSVSRIALARPDF